MGTLAAGAIPFKYVHLSVRTLVSIIFILFLGEGKSLPCGRHAFPSASVLVPAIIFQTSPQWHNLKFETCMTAFNGG